MASIGYYHRKYGWDPNAYPAALQADTSTISLPIYPGLSEAEQARVIQAVCSFRP
jgi:dTDP-4-amino-4,6-dideoxygalactose transaminase